MFERGGKARVLIVPLLVGCAVAGMLILGRLEKLELISIDLRYSLLGRPSHAPLALIAIDQNSIKDVGVWPWPREIYAGMFDVLEREKARCLLVDLDFSSLSTNPEADRIFVEAVADSVPTFLAMHMEEKAGEGGFILRNLSIPFPQLAEAAAGIGSIVFDVDPDGSVRRMPPNVEFGDRIFQPLGVLGARMINPELSYAPPRGAMFSLSRELLDTIPMIPFADVANDEYPEGIFRDRVVLLGATSLDLRDYWSSPLGVIPGVYLHAAVLETALDGSFLVRSSRGVVLALLFACSMLLGVGLGRSGWKGGAVFLGAYLILAVGVSILLLRLDIMLETVPILLVGLAQYPIQVALHARRTEEVLDMEKRRTDAILKMSELEDAEETGQQPYVVPLVLLRQVMNLVTVRLFLIEGEMRDSWREDAVIGETSHACDENLIREVVKGGELIRAKGESGGAVVYVPLKTVRRPVGILFVAGPAEFHATDSDLRLLLSYATQTAYFLESKELAEKMKEEETVRTNLARYLSPQIVEQIIQDKVQVNLGGDRKVVAVLFSDIRNFTTISETMPPDRLVAILNDYFNEMASIIFQYQGSLDKYIGDAIVAVFGSLIELKNPSLAATQAAVAMMKHMLRLNRRWAQKYDGFTMNIGIGVNTGEVFLGNIGSLERMEFTVIGDTVNVASRFSGLARPGQVLLTEEARAGVGEALRLNELPATPVKGKSEPLRVFEVLYSMPDAG